VLDLPSFAERPPQADPCLQHYNYTSIWAHCAKNLPAMAAGSFYVRIANRQCYLDNRSIMVLLFHQYTVSGYLVYLWPFGLKPLVKHEADYPGRCSGDRLDILGGVFS